METKFIAMIVGVALVLAATTTYTQSVFAVLNPPFQHVVTGGQTGHGLVPSCSNPIVDQKNKNCHLPS